MSSTCRCFLFAALLFTWAFAGCANHIPELLPIGNKSVDEGTLLSFTAMASDEDLPVHNSFHKRSLLVDPRK